jgi:hypothetical protein
MNKAELETFPTPFVGEIDILIEDGSGYYGVHHARYQIIDGVGRIVLQKYRNALVEGEEDD